MGKLEKLNELLEKNFGMQIDDEDRFYGVEDTLKYHNKALTVQELKDEWNGIGKIIKKLEPYKGYKCINCVDIQMGGQLGQGYLIVDNDNDLNYIDFIETM